jgi:steroid delta-isomerase-like uncharacterized protein
LGRRVLTEIYEKKTFALADQLYADDFVDDSPGGGKGRELIKRAVSDFHTTVPDLHVDFEDIFAADDKVVRFVARGTQTGPYYGAIPSTGKKVDVRGIMILQIMGGKVKTDWTEYDRLGMLRQLGVVP